MGNTLFCCDTTLLSGSGIKPFKSFILLSLNIWSSDSSVRETNSLSAVLMCYPFYETGPKKNMKTTYNQNSNTKYNRPKFLWFFNNHYRLKTTHTAIQSFPYPSLSWAFHLPFSSIQISSSPAESGWKLSVPVVSQFHSDTLTVREGGRKMKKDGETDNNLSYQVRKMNKMYEYQVCNMVPWGHALPSEQFYSLLAFCQSPALWRMN